MVTTWLLLLKDYFKNFLKDIFKKSSCMLSLLLYNLESKPPPESKPPLQCISDGQVSRRNPGVFPGLLSRLYSTSYSVISQLVLCQDQCKGVKGDLDWTSFGLIVHGCPKGQYTTLYY